MRSLKLASGLYPFQLSDLPQFEFDRFVLSNVFEKITTIQQQACVELWLRNGVIPSREAALARSLEVCYFITERATGELVGVNTLYPATNTDVVRNVWLNRMFIAPQHRTSRLMITGTAMMLCFAKTQLADRGLLGVVNVNENRKLSRPGMNRIFDRLGYQDVGSHNGNVVLFFEFANVEFISS